MPYWWRLQEQLESQRVFFEEAARREDHHRVEAVRIPEDTISYTGTGSTQEVRLASPRAVLERWPSRFNPDLHRSRSREYLAILGGPDYMYQPRGSVVLMTGNVGREFKRLVPYEEN